MLKLATLDELMDDLLAAPALACLPGWRENGIDALAGLGFGRDRKLKTKKRAIEALLAVSLGRPVKERDMMFLLDDWDSIEKYSVGPDLQAYSYKLLREKLLIALAEPDTKRDLFYLIGNML